MSARADVDGNGHDAGELNSRRRHQNGDEGTLERCQVLEVRSGQPARQKTERRGRDRIHAGVEECHLEATLRRELAEAGGLGLEGDLEGGEHRLVHDPGARLECPDAILVREAQGRIELQSQRGFTIDGDAVLRNGHLEVTARLDADELDRSRHSFEAELIDVEARRREVLEGTLVVGDLDEGAAHLDAEMRELPGRQRNPRDELLQVVLNRQQIHGDRLVQERDDRAIGADELDRLE